MSLNFIQLLRRVFIVLTLGCCAYVAVFFYKNPPANMVMDVGQQAPEENLLTPELKVNASAFDSKLIKSRDLFSTATDSPTTAVTEETPTGQLPSNLKVVAIVISHPSQIVIEDTAKKQTFFITEGKPQAGISIAKVQADQIILNYQGQSISVSVKNLKALSSDE